MAKARKDHRGRALRKGEIQRKDKTYMYTYTDPYGKRRYIYANDLVELREKEKRLMKDQLDGLDVYAAGNADLNFVFDRYITTKTELRRTTYTNYTYMYDRFVRNEFGKRKIGTIKYSDVLYFYYHLLNDKGMQINTLETIHTVLHPTFQLAVRLTMPFLLTSMVVGVIIAIFQAATQINEQTLTFVPKFLSILAIMGFLGSTILTMLQDFVRQMAGLIAGG